MNYLVVEGYKDAAEQFSIESGLAPMVDIASIQDRMDIRRAVQSGNVDAAIERVNDLNPDVSNALLTIISKPIIYLLTFGLYFRHRYWIPTLICSFTCSSNAS